MATLGRWTLTGIAAGLLLAATGATVWSASPPDARDVVDCEGSSRQAVRQCCDAVVRAQGLPDWMRLQWLDCRMVVHCAPRGNKGNYCRVQLRPLILEQEVP